MRIQVSGKQIDIGDALRGHVENRIGDVIGKYADRAVEAMFIAEGSVHLPTGLTAQAKGRASEIYASFENAVERLDKQLRRYKRRLKDHHRNREFPIEAIDAPSYILASNEEHGEDNEPATLQPVIVAEMETRVPYLSVGEAVMQMELAGAGMLVFRNVAHGGVNVVHRRDDGNIGWIDPRLIQ